MQHRDLYHWLLVPERRGALLQTIAAQGYQASLGYTEAVVIDGPLPYVRAIIPRNGTHVAHAGGIYLDLGEYPELRHTGRFYLPALAMVDLEDPIALAHELLHVKDLLDCIERDPTYPARAEAMARFERDDPTSMEERIDFEIAKIFDLEPQAFQQEYRSGVRTIDVPVFLGMRLPLPCVSEEEFVQTWLADYVGKVEQGWKGRFPLLTVRVEAAVRDAVDRRGRRVFGDGAFEAARGNRADVSKRILDRVLRVSAFEGNPPPGC